MNNNLVQELVNNFLSWKLPKDFSPDCGISFFGDGEFEPIGTNLFTATQAKSMFEYLLDKSKPVGECVTNPFGVNDVCAVKWIDDNYKPKLGDRLYALPKPLVVANNAKEIS